MSSLMKIKTGSDLMSADYNLAKMLDTPGGFEKVAAEKLPPFIVEQRDYEAFGRKVLAVHTVAPEELHIIDNEPYIYYPKDLNSHAAYFADDSEIPRYQVEGDGVNVGIVTLASDEHTIHLKRLMTQRFAYLDRVRELAGISVAKLEDMKILRMVDKLLENNTDQIKFVPNRTNLQKEDLAAIKKPFSKHDVPIANFVMNPATLDDVLLWGQDEVDQLTQRELLDMGVKYSIWGIPIITSSLLKENVVYAFAEQHYVGTMPILKDLTVKLTDTPVKLEKGLFMFEFIGFYIASHKACAKLVLNAETLDAAKVVSGIRTDVTDGTEDGTYGKHGEKPKDNGSYQTGLL